MDFYEALSFIRRRLNISQGDMLENTTHSTYSRIESGKRQIKLDTLGLIAKKLGMNFKELLEFSNFDDDYGLIAAKRVKIPVRDFYPDLSTF